MANDPESEGNMVSPSLCWYVKCLLDTKWFFSVVPNLGLSDKVKTHILI